VITATYGVVRFRTGAGVRQNLRKFAADGGELICANNADKLTEELEAAAGKHALNCRGVWRDDDARQIKAVGRRMQ